MKVPVRLAAVYLVGIFTLLFQNANIIQAQTLRTETGLWNGFLSQVNVIECINTQLSPADVKIQILDNLSGLKRELQATIVANASHHFLLPAELIRDQIGTYKVSVTNTSTAELGHVHCLTAFYRFSSSVPNKLEYAYALPTLIAQSNPFYGLFNSYNPSPGGEPVWNWLSIVNLGETDLRAVVEVFPQGKTVPSSRQPIVVKPGQRIDRALGHPDGQVVGTYRVVPEGANSRFTTVLMRYNSLAGDNFGFAFPLIGRFGTYDSGMIVASTTANATNWFEVGNVTEIPADVQISVRDVRGVLVNSKTVRIPGFGQYHLHVNSSLGSAKTGSVQAKLLDSSSGARLLVQSNYYGFDSNNSLNWAYASQPKSGIEMQSCRQYLSLNTNLKAGNWLKLLNEGEEPVFPEVSLSNSAGIEVESSRTREILAYGSNDVGINQAIGDNQIGSLGITPGVRAGLLASALRVFQSDNGDVETIMEIPSFVEYCAESPNYDFANYPDNWGNLLSHSEYRRSKGTYRPGLDYLETFSDYRGLPVDVLVRKPRLGNSPTEIVVAAPTGIGATDYQAFKAAFEQARTNSPAKVILQPGNYLVDTGSAKEHISLSGLKDIEIDGRGAVVKFTNYKRPGILILDSERLHIHDLNLDWNYEPAVAVNIRLSSTVADQREIHILGGQSINPIDFQAIYNFDYNTKSWTPHVNSERYLLPEGQLLTELRPGVYTHPGLNRLSVNRKGILMTSRTGRAGTMQARGAKTQDITVERVGFWNTPQMFFNALGGRGYNLTDCRIERAPDDSTRLIAGRADGFHIGGATGDIIIKNNLVVDQGDDGINLRGLDLYANSVIPSEAAVLMESRPDIRANHSYELELLNSGDLVSFMDTNVEPVAVLRVVKRTEISATASKVFFEAPRGENLSQLMLKIQPGMRLYNLSRTSPRFIVRNNYFGNNAGRGMIISATNGLVADNQIVGPRMSGILMATFNGAFYEGPGAVNVKVVGNTIRKTNNSGGVVNAPAGAITVFAEEVKAEVDFPRMQDLLIKDNLIEEVQGLAVQVLHARDVKLFDNTIVRANTQPFVEPRRSDTTVPQGSIMFEDSCVARIYGNSRIPGDTTLPIYIDSETTCSMSYQRNY